MRIRVWVLDMRQLFEYRTTFWWKRKIVFFFSQYEDHESFTMAIFRLQLPIKRSVCRANSPRNGHSSTGPSQFPVLRRYFFFGRPRKYYCKNVWPAVTRPTLRQTKPFRITHWHSAEQQQLLRKIRANSFASTEWTRKMQLRTIGIESVFCLRPSASE